MRKPGILWALVCAGLLLVAACDKTEVGVPAPVQPPGAEPTPTPTPTPKPPEPAEYYKPDPPVEPGPPQREPEEVDLPSDVIEVVSPKRCGRVVGGLVECRTEVLGTFPVTANAKLLRFKTILLGNCSTPYPVFVTISFDGKVTAQQEILMNRQWIAEVKGDKVSLARIRNYGASYDSTCRVGLRMTIDGE